MNFVEDLRLLHVDAKQIPCLTGKGAPTVKTEGAAGVLYMDVDTGALYKCRGGGKGQYRWENAAPVKGVDYFTEADKGELVELVLASLGGDVISGYVDTDNSIVIRGLPDGSYTVRYEMGDGSTLQIGDLVVDTQVSYTNLAQPDPDATGEAVWNAGGWCNGSYIAGTSYAFRSSTDMTRVTTNVFEVEAGDTVYVKGISYTGTASAQIALFDAGMNRIYSSTVSQTANNGYILDLAAEEGSDYWSFRSATSSGDNNARFIRFSGYLSGGVDDVIITRNQPIE